MRNIRVFLLLLLIGSVASAQNVSYRDHGVASDLSFYLVEADGVSPATGVSCVGGDVKILKDGGASANSASCFSERGNGWYNVPLTAAELTAKDIQISFTDQDGPAWLASATLIETAGASGSGARHEDAAASLTLIDYQTLADFVWNEDLSTYLTLNSAGQLVAGTYTQVLPSNIQSSVWGANQATYNAAGTMGGSLDSAAAGGGGGGSCPTAAAVADAVGDLVIDSQTGLTWQEHESLAAAILYGRTDNFGLTFKTFDNGATRVVSTVNADRERTSITVSPSP